MIVEDQEFQSISNDLKEKILMLIAHFIKNKEEGKHGKTSQETVGNTTKVKASHSGDVKNEFDKVKLKVEDREDFTIEVDPTIHEDFNVEEDKEFEGLKAEVEDEEDDDEDKELIEALDNDYFHLQDLVEKKVDIPENALIKTGNNGFRRLVKSKEAPVKSDLSYSCNLCKFECKKEIGLDRHMARDHKEMLKTSGVYNFTCDLCDEVFSSFNHKCRHIRNVHGKYKDPRTGPKKKRGNWFLAEKQFECKECNLRFRYPYSMKKHMFQTHGPGLCDKCGLPMVTYDLYKSHLLKEHGVDLDADLLKCDECNRLFYTPETLEEHKQRVHVRVLCTECGKELEPKKLKKHMFLVHEQKICKDCGMEFTDAAKFFAHQDTHVKNMEYVCEVCSKMFRSVKSLRIHKRVHSDKSQHKVCPICGSTVKNLEIHHRFQHEDPTKCPQCDYVAGRLAMEKHFQQNHAAREMQECELCNRKFKDLRRHIQTFHVEHEVFQCEYCDFKTKWSHNMNAHVKKVHVDKCPPLETCPHCGKEIVHTMENHLRKCPQHPSRYLTNNQIATN